MFALMQKNNGDQRESMLDNSSNDGQREGMLDEDSRPNPFAFHTKSTFGGSSKEKPTQEQTSSFRK